MIQIDIVGVRTLGLNVYECIQFIDLYGIVNDAGDAVGVL